MKIDFGKQTCLYPMPVLIIATYDEDGNADIMNAAWGGIHDTNQLGLCISYEHKTAKNILLKKAFTVSMGQADFVAQCDYVGLVSANDDKDKVKKSGFTVTKSKNVDAPIINELAMCLECELVSYDKETGCTVANIINMSAEEGVLTDGKIDISKLKPITFDPINHKYVQLGDVVGNAFSDGKQIG